MRRQPVVCRTVHPTAIDELAAYALDPDAVALAAWYHDAVYRGQADDEKCSAQRAERDLTALRLAPELVGEVGTTGRTVKTAESFCKYSLAGWSTVKQSALNANDNAPTH